jgi:DNA polymerase-1
VSKKLYLIDGSSYIYRAYHAITPLSTSKGLPTHAIYGVTNMLLKILKEKQPTYIAVVWDAKGPTFRHKESPDYKANRPPMPDDLVQQIPYIKRIVDALGLPSLEKEGYEADDLIASLCKLFQDEDIEIVIVSGDKDLRQLLSSKVSMWDSMRDKTLTAEDILKQYNLPPARLKEVMALTGDKIDNIPGVPGIGEKTAIRLLQQFGSLKELLNRIEEVKPERIKKNLLAFKEQILLNLKLVSLAEDVPLEVSLADLRLREQKRQELKSLFEALEFRRLLNEFLLLEQLPAGNYQTVLTPKELTALVKTLRQAKEVAIVIKSTSLEPMRAEIVGLSFCLEHGKAWYVPVGHFYLGVPKQLSLKEALAQLKPIFEDKGISKIGHDLKRLILILRRHGIELKGISFDTMLGAYCLNPNHTEPDLDTLVQTYLKLSRRYKEEKKINTAQMPIEKAAQMVGEEAELIFRLYQVLNVQLKAKKQMSLFTEIELPLVPVLAEMEWWGVRVDRAYLEELAKQFTSRLREIERNIFVLAGEQFNINSPQQLRHILFEKLKLPPVKKTKGKGGYSTDAEVLNKLALLHPLPKEILRYRMLMKLKSTYIDILPQLIHPQTGRIHTSYNQAVTATGRLSSSNPNLQNIPTRGEEGKAIRRAFIPEDGWYYLAADYSQIELRLLAHFSQDEKLLEAFLRGEDIHAHTASEVFGVHPEAITSDMRRQAKVINFGIIYGMSPYGLSKELDLSVKMAQQYIEEYFKRYPGVKRYIETVLKQAREQGYVETLFKRRRYLPEINSKNLTLRKAAERIAINTPIQGTAAEIIKKAMIALGEAIKKQGLKSKMIMQVHDELIFEVPPEEIALMQQLVKEKMESVMSLRVPLTVKIKIGKNWAEVS